MSSTTLIIILAVLDGLLGVALLAVYVLADKWHARALAAEARLAPLLPPKTGFSGHIEVEVDQGTMVIAFKDGLITSTAIRTD
ncbi:MAG TPA: hypothetical protein VEA69_16675 [Tepidisphaeraceae bacterium]|nr:hypothetical protein [Tepidisphaeraceae bacterium]